MCDPFLCGHGWDESNSYPRFITLEVNIQKSALKKNNLLGDVAVNVSSLLLILIIKCSSNSKSRFVYYMFHITIHNSCTLT